MPGRNLQQTYDPAVQPPAECLRLAFIAARFGPGDASGVGTVFVENVSAPRLLEQISRETQAVIGGTLYSDALSGSDGPVATYLDLFSQNLRLVTNALAP